MYAQRHQSSVAVRRKLASASGRSGNSLVRRPPHVLVVRDNVHKRRAALRLLATRCAYAAQRLVVLCLRRSTIPFLYGTMFIRAALRCASLRRAAPTPHSASLCCACAVPQFRFYILFFRVQTDRSNSHLHHLLLHDERNLLLNCNNNNK